MIKVLIVDDQMLVRAGFRMILDAQNDMSVAGEAGDGETAVALATELRPDLVIMDVKMPQLDGISAAERLTRNHIAPVVLLTAFSQKELVERASEAGVEVLQLVYNRLERKAEEQSFPSAMKQELGVLARERGLVLQVGHLERFSAAYQAMVGRIGAPLYIEATRIAPFKPRGTDVSVILDLMIHDLDLVLALVDSEIESVDAVGAPVSSPHEDIANARIKFSNGAVATITASRISLKTERKIC